LAVLAQNGIPLYHQLKEIFVEKIVNGEWSAGGTIPPEYQLCEQYGVSRGPVRQALEQLVQEGLLARKQGKGSWVLPPKIEREPGAFFSFTTLIQQKGQKHQARLLSLETVPASSGVTRSLSLTHGEAVIRITRLRLADQEPLVLETIYLPQKCCPGLAEAHLAAAPLYAILSSRYGLPPLRARQFFEPVVTDEYEAQVLQVARGAPALLIQNITYTTGDRPIVLSKAIMRGDRVRYYVELTAPAKP
jgi:GntR family transcriptional regulator